MPPSRRFAPFWTRSDGPALTMSAVAAGRRHRAATARGGAGTSGGAGIRTVILAGDPSKRGPDLIERRVIAHTRIAAHTDRDDRSAERSKVCAQACFAPFAAWHRHRASRPRNGECTGIETLLGSLLSPKADAIDVPDYHLAG